MGGRDFTMFDGYFQLRRGVSFLMAFCREEEMKQIVSLRFLALLVFCGMLGSTSAFAGGNSLTIGNGSATGLESGTVDVTMDASSDVEGFVLAIGFDTSLISVTNIEIIGDASASLPELVAPELFDVAGGATLGVVLETDGVDALGHVIPAGSGLSIARLTISPDILVAATTPVDLLFTDGTFNSPTLDNVIVQGGLSVGQGQGLGLTNGVFTLFAPPPDELRIVGGQILPGEEGCAQVELDLSSGDCQGYVLAIAHDSAQLTLTDINLDGSAMPAGDGMAEFVATNLLLLNGGTVGVVFDVNAPFAGQTLANNQTHVLANFCYTCVSTPFQPDPNTFHDLTFVDGVLGAPALDNVIVVQGLSLNPALTNGQMECVAALPEDTEYYCGIQNPDWSFGDTVNPPIIDPTGTPGSTIDMCFFWTDPTDNIAGFQLAVCYDAELEFVEESFTV